jgi:hypothetical protein
VNPVAVDVFVPNVIAGVAEIVFVALAPVPPEFTPATVIVRAVVPATLNVAVVAVVPFLGYTKPLESVNTFPLIVLNA